MGFGDGVINSGTFEMYSGKISNNNANAGYDGAVYNSGYGTFSMFGGEISNNTGFGVYNRQKPNSWSLTGESNYGTFSMSGGLISNNDGGGVQNSGIFSMTGGEISNNVAGHLEQSGGGVSNSGVFSMSGGVISNNQATYGGGVYNYPEGNFSLSENAIISGNKAEVGGGVYNAGAFNRHDGVISGNTATQYNNIYPNGNSLTYFKHYCFTKPNFSNTNHQYWFTCRTVPVSAFSCCLGYLSGCYRISYAFQKASKVVNLKQ